MGWTRRGVLLGCCAVMGCAPGPAIGATSGVPSPSAVARQSALPDATPTVGVSPLVPSSPLASASPPTREAVVAEFGRRVPVAWGTGLAGIEAQFGAAEAFLTFDACGGPAGSAVDADLLATLRRRGVPATLFLNQRWIEANASLAAELAADTLFRLESHGRRHLPLSVTGRAAYGIAGTRDAGEVYDELTAADDWFVNHTGRRPAWFRSGTAHVDDVAVAIAGRLGHRLAGFAVNADAGATASRAQVASALASVRAGDIVLAHMNRPKGQTAEGLADALPRLLDHGVRFAKLP